MLALVRLHASPRYLSLVSTYDELPAQPQRMSAAAVRCDGPGSLEAALRWHRECLRRQRVFPFALVVPRDAAITRRIVLEAAAEPTVLLFDDELAGSRLPDEVVEVLCHGGILLRIEETILRDAGVELSADERVVLRQLVSAGAGGRRAAGAASSARMSESTLRRWLRERGLPPVGRLLRKVRIDALRHLEHAGVDFGTASRLCGWSSARAARLACTRAEDRGRAPAAA